MPVEAVWTSKVIFSVADLPKSLQPIAAYTAEGMVRKRTLWAAAVLKY